MTRRMSCSLTTDAVRERRKTVTRRHVDTWKDLRAGDRLILVEKAMGLPKGTKQVVLAEVEVVSVTVERLGCITWDEVQKEGRLWPSPEDFIRFWLDGHGMGALLAEHGLAAADEVSVRRIEWRYLDPPA